MIEKEIAENPVVVFSYTLSPFCTEAKKLLAEQGAKVKAIELAAEWIPGLLPAEGAAVRAELGEAVHAELGAVVTVAVGGLCTATHAEARRQAGDHGRAGLAEMA